MIYHDYLFLKKHTLLNLQLAFATWRSTRKIVLYLWNIQFWRENDYSSSMFPVLWISIVTRTYHPFSSSWPTLFILNDKLVNASNTNCYRFLGLVVLQSQRFQSWHLPKVCSLIVGKLFAIRIDSHIRLFPGQRTPL